MKCNLIAIAGLKNSGKDCAAKMVQYILNAPSFLHNYNCYQKLNKFFIKRWKITSFAKPLKQVLSAMINVDVNKFDDRDFKENYCIDFTTLTVHPIKDCEYCIISDNKFTKLIEDSNFVAEKYCLTIRQLMQYIGTNILRKAVTDKLWILSTLSQDNLIISDLRFKVEEQEVHKRNGKIIYIQRPSAIPGNHASEREVIEMYEQHKFDIVISNSGTKEDLFYYLKNELQLTINNS